MESENIRLGKRLLAALSGLTSALPLIVGSVLTVTFLGFFAVVALMFSGEENPRTVQAWSGFIFVCVLLVLACNLFGVFAALLRPSLARWPLVGAKWGPSLLLVPILWSIVGAGESDQEIIKNFRANRADYERLLAAHRADSSLRLESFNLIDLGVTRMFKEDGGLRLKFQRTSYGGWDEGGTKGILHSEFPPHDDTVGSEQQFYRLIEGNWYIYDHVFN